MDLAASILSRSTRPNGSCWEPWVPRGSSSGGQLGPEAGAGASHRWGGQPGPLRVAWEREATLGRPQRTSFASLYHTDGNAEAQREEGIRPKTHSMGGAEPGEESDLLGSSGHTPSALATGFPVSPRPAPGPGTLSQHSTPTQGPPRDPESASALLTPPPAQLVILCPQCLSAQTPPCPGDTVCFPGPADPSSSLLLFRLPPRSPQVPTAAAKPFLLPCHPRRANLLAHPKRKSPHSSPWPPGEVWALQQDVPGPSWFPSSTLPTPQMPILPPPPPAFEPFTCCCLPGMLFPNPFSWILHSLQVSAETPPPPGSPP